MLEKNQEVIVKIESYGSEGQGVARVDGFVVFVPFVLVGETVKVHIIKITKNYAVAKVVEIIEKSKDRVVPKCSIYGKCGGCSIQHASYLHGLSIKKNRVQDSLSKIGGFSNVEVKDVVPSESEYYYRNKAAFPIVINKDGLVDICMYRRLSHDGISIDVCNISHPIINDIIKIFREYANKNFSQKTKTSLRNLVVRVINDKVLVTIVSLDEPQNTDVFFNKLLNGLNLTKEDVGIYWCKKTRDNNVILEGKLIYLNGIKVITANILGVDVEVSPLSFFQVNLEVMKKLYTRVLDSIKENEIVVDAYSGAGLMSACISKKAKFVYGIEIIDAATKNADALKKNNKIENLKNINGDVSVLLPKVVKEINQEFTIVLDPPRKGVDEKVIKTISNEKPKEIIYVACDPSSLARDLKLIVNEGYRIVEILPFDMFPQTSEVETFAKLERI